MPTNVLEGQFVPIGQIIDSQEINDNPKIEADLKQILIRIVQALENHAQSINLKDTGLYSLQEFVNGQVYFPNPALSSATAQLPTQRQVFRVTVNFGALPNAAVKTVAHGIVVDANTTFTHIYAAATDTTAFQGIPVPMVFTATANSVDLQVDATNVIIETDFNATNYNVCYVVLEYIRQ